MKTQHIQLENYNIITSDEEIKDGDWCLFFWDGGQIGSDEPKQYNPKEGHVLNSGLKKTIASTNPKHNLPSINYNGLEKEFGIVDVEKLADIYSFNRWSDEELLAESKFSFIKGFNKSESLNDKKFSLEDMGNLWDFCTYNKGGFKEFIQSLQQPKVTDVEVEEVGKIGSYRSVLYSKEPKITDHQIKILKIL